MNWRNVIVFMTKRGHYEAASNLMAYSTANFLEGKDQAIWARQHIRYRIQIMGEIQSVIGAYMMEGLALAAQIPYESEEGGYIFIRTHFKFPEFWEQFEKYISDKYPHLL